MRLLFKITEKRTREDCCVTYLTILQYFGVTAALSILHRWSQPTNLFGYCRRTNFAREIGDDIRPEQRTASVEQIKIWIIYLLKLGWASLTTLFLLRRQPRKICRIFFSGLWVDFVKLVKINDLSVISRFLDKLRPDCAKYWNLLFYL